MNNTELKGRLMLKVVGIFYIVLAAISILIGLVVIAGGLVAIVGGATLGIAGGEGIIFSLGVAFGVLGLIAIFSNVFSLVLGILGVVWCARPDRATALFVLGLIFALLAAVSLLFSLDTDNLSTVTGNGLRLVLAALYTLGAWRNKQTLQ